MPKRKESRCRGILGSNTTVLLMPDGEQHASSSITTASGIRFGALEWGPRTGPLVLCLHGFPDTAWTWRRLGPVLAAEGWHVVAPFMRGYGPTDLAPDGCYQLGALVRDVEELHAALGG